MKPSTTRSSLLPRTGLKVNQYTLGKGIAATNSSLVFETNNSATNERLAIKMMKANEKSNQSPKDEMYLMCNLNFPYLIKILDEFYYKNYHCIVMPFAVGGNLYDYIYQNNVSDISLKKIIFQAISSVAYLHDNHIIHRDIKPENFLVVDKNEPKIMLSDFGFAIKTNEGEKHNKFGGTLNCVSPEILNMIPFDNRTDIWSLGVTIFYIWCGKFPFSDGTKSGLINKIKSGKVQYPVDICNEVKELISKMIVIHPGKRITAKEATELAWFDDIRPKSI